MTPEFVIEAFQLTKSYRRTMAVNEVTFCVAPGQVTAFLGQNGAGKTSTIKMLMGFSSPSRGSARILGEPITDRRRSCAARSRIAYVAENKLLYGYMTVIQLIRFTKSFYADWDDRLEHQLLREYELPPDRKISSLSKGMRTKVALLLAFARRPELLVLDEPSEGLDPVGIEHLLQTLAARSADGAAVFFSSHQIGEVERIADHVLMIDRGKVVLDAPMDTVREEYRRIEAVFEHPPSAAELYARGVERVTIHERSVEVLVSGNAEEVATLLHSFGSTSLSVSPIGLREIFLEKATAR